MTLRCPGERRRGCGSCSRRRSRVGRCANGITRCTRCTRCDLDMPTGIGSENTSIGAADTAALADEAPSTRCRASSDIDARIERDGETSLMPLHGHSHWYSTPDRGVQRARTRNLE